MVVRPTSQAAAVRLALLLAVVVTAITTGQTSTKTFQLKGDLSELSGTAHGSTLTPSIGPLGTLVVAGSGVLDFGPVGAGTGVAFRPGGWQASNIAYYRFGGQSVGTLFNASGGDVTFFLKSRYSFANRQLGSSKWAFDVYDASQNLFTFYVSTYGGFLNFNYRAGGVVTNTYFVSPGQEDATFGSGVVMKVRILWDGSKDYLYLNDALVQTTGYSSVVPNWTAASSFVIGTKQDLTYGAGYFSSDDWISQLGVTSAAQGVPPAKAGSPSPATGSVGVAVTSALSWAASVNATTYDVYFGQTLPASPTSANLTTTTFAPPGGMATSSNYVWRVDAKNAFGTTTGDVWSFTTAAPPPPPPKVGSPSPVNGSTSVSVGAALSWAASTGATAYDLYLGTTLPSSPTWTNMAATTYGPPGGFAANTKYFWRVDAKNSSGMTTGDVWSFTTSAAPPPAPPKPTTPSPANLASNVGVGTSLSWVGSTQAAGYDLYFGATLPTTPTVSGLTASTYTPGTSLAYATTYSWRVDAKNGSGTTAGDVWTFTTGLAPAVTSVTVTPTADSAIHSVAPTSNLGSAPVVTLYTGTSALYAFSLPSLPSGAVLMSAKLQLSVSGYDDGYPTAADEYAIVGLYRLTRPWTESAVTNNKATATTSWTSPGGDYDSTTDFGKGPNGLVAEALSRLSQTPESLTFDVTALAAKWYQNAYPNYGFLLRQIEHQGGPMMNFREVSNSTKAPALVVTYAVTAAAPTVVSVTPSNGAANMPADQLITFVLNDLVGVNPGSLSFIVNGVQQASQVQLSGPQNSATLTYTPTIPYGHSTSVNATLSIQNWAGNPLNTGITFTVAPTDTVAPVVTGAFPLAGATDVPTSATFAFKLIDRDSGVDLTTLSIKLNGSDITGAVQMLPVSGGYQLRYAPASPLPAGQAATYTVTSCDKAVPRNCLTNYTYTYTTLPTGNWFRGTIHQHTGDYSFDADPASTISSAANAVRSLGDQFLVFAQHQYKSVSKGLLWTPAELQSIAAAEGALGDAGFAVIGGQELFTNQGHTITFGVSWNKNPQSIYDLQSYANSQLGVFAFAHPDYPSCPCTPKNISDYRFLSDPLYMAAYTTAGTSYTPGRDGWSSGFGFLAAGGFYDQMLALGRKVYMYGETDYHGNAPKAGGSVALLYGSLPTQAKVIDAIRTGRVYVTGSPALTLDFTVNGYPVGSDLAALVDDVSLGISVKAAVAGGTVDQVTVIRDNSTFFAASPAASSFSRLLTASVAKGSRTYFRVVVAARDATGQVVRAASNPIFVGTR